MIPAETKKIQVRVERFPSEADWTLSEFFINDIKKGVGVEDEKREIKVHGETRIDNGIYELGLRISPRFSKSYFVDEHGNLSTTKSERFTKEHEMIWVMGVPLFEFILWHWGNSDDDTDGCYIVGSSFATFDKQKGVAGSRVKYTEIYPLIWNIIQDNKKAGLKTYVEYREKIFS